MTTNPVKSRLSQFPMTGNYWELGNYRSEKCEKENDS